MTSASAALFLDPGLGKTSIVLETFRRLKERGAAKRMLVVAPLRVCQTVWRQEGQKWTQFRDITFAFLHGSDKAKTEALASTADVTLINPEGIVWLAEHSYFPWDTVVIDELTRFKNQSAQRHKALRPLLKHARRRWGLTGTPAPNGFLDLFGQFLILDDGAALGKFVTHYRMQYFVPGHDGYSWKLQPNGQKRIEERIKPYVLRMSAEDYLSLPPLVDDVREVELPEKALKTYRQMRDDMLAELPGGVVTAENAGGVANKLRQMAGGATYRAAGAAEPSGGTQTAPPYETLHSAKIEAVADLVEELAGQPLLLAYGYTHELERLLEKFPETPYLGNGVTPKRTQEIVDAWNRGEVPLLLAHPASAGHGLNMQGAGCGHIGWFGPTYDLEHYDQFIARVRRQGNDAERIINHIFVAKGTIDESILKIVREKGTTQAGLLQRLGAAITEESSMEKLGTQSGERVWPAGWGPPPSANGSGTPQQQATAEMLQEAAVGTARKSNVALARADEAMKNAAVTEMLQEAAAPERTRADEAKQKAAIRAKIDGSQPPPDRAAAAKALFSPEVQKAMEGTPNPPDHPAGAVVVSPPTAPEIDYDKLAAAIVRNVAKRFLG